MNRKGTAIVYISHGHSRSDSIVSIGAFMGSVVKP